MPQLIEATSSSFVDRRTVPSDGRPQGPERRQFSNSYSSERPEVAELAEAVDRYKLRHRRRFITFEELYDVIEGLGYHK
ncbi:MAG: hypothetical protein KY476_14340 [Planctomycetes bacterium]|nr:hypothetical protein [Planctomycetota bacterium]